MRKHKLTSVGVDRRPERTLAGSIKRTSVLRRIPTFETVRYLRVPGLEGDVCVFAVAKDAKPIVVEASSGRAMTLAPRDIFLATPGYRESTRWVVGGIPDGGLLPGAHYWILAESGVVGNLFGDSPLEKSYVGRVKYLGAVQSDKGKKCNINQFTVSTGNPGADHGAPVFLVLGTSAEVGKTTAAVAILRRLRQSRATVIAFKATGTSSLVEISTYLDFGASEAFDCIDFGLPTTYPSDRQGIRKIFARALDVCLSLHADAVLIECGGDMFGANVPVFLSCLRQRRPHTKVILAAADAPGALGARQVLQKIGLRVSLITGPCTDTPTLQDRTQAVCATPAINLARGDDIGTVLKF